MKIDGDEQRRPENDTGQRGLDVVRRGSVPGRTNPGAAPLERRSHASRRVVLRWDAARAGPTARPRPAALAALAGDRHAFGGLLRRHAGRVHERGDHVEHRALVGRRHRHVVRPARHQRAALGRRELNSAAESLAHWSNLPRSMPMRTGIEPLFRLNTSWNLRLHDRRGQVRLRLLRVGVLLLEHDEAVDVEGERALGARGAACRRSPCPATLPAAVNSPLAQSPMNCMPALPLMTIAVARFQSRLAASLSMYFCTWRRVAKAFSICGLLSALGSRSTKAFLYHSAPPTPKRDRLEQGRVLPGLAAVRDGDEAGLLDLVGGDEELVPGGRDLGAGLLEHLGVGPHPVHAVHVDRHGDVVALVLHHVADHRRAAGRPSCRPWRRRSGWRARPRRPIPGCPGP